MDYFIGIASTCIAFLLYRLFSDKVDDHVIVITLIGAFIAICILAYVA